MARRGRKPREEERNAPDTANARDESPENSGETTVNNGETDVIQKNIAKNEDYFQSGIDKPRSKHDLYVKIINERQMSTVTKAQNINTFLALHPGLRFPQPIQTDMKIRYIEHVSHFKLFEGTND